jgi:hypothetical protein
MNIYVLETKNFHYGLKITPEGEFLVYDGKKYFAIESPIEQNERHIFLLSKAIDHYSIMPTRLGVVIPPRFVSHVLVSPTSKITDHPDPSLIQAMSFSPTRRSPGL